MWIRGTCVAGGLLVGSGATMSVLSYGHDIYLQMIGMTTLLCGTVAIAAGRVIRIVSRHQRSADEAFELGQQMGYEKGYCEGRRTARPVVVPMRGRQGLAGAAGGRP